MNPPHTLRPASSLHRAQRRPRSIAFAAHLLCSGLCVAAGTIAPLCVASAQTPTAAAARAYAIPAGPLGAALNRLGSESGVLITFTPELTSGLRSPGLQGSYTVPQALAALLAGTPLQPAVSADGSYTLRRAPEVQGAALPSRSNNSTLAEVTVTGDYLGSARTAPYASGNVSASTKLGTPLIETPRSISIVTQEQLQTQAPKSIEQALSYTAGVSTGLGGVDIRMSGATIRGFSDGSSYYKDGLRQLAAGSYGSWNDDIDELESIEVIKGPASVLFGQGRPGGVINVVSKRPTADHVNSIGLSYGRYDRRQVTADLGGAIGDEDKLLYRLNVMGRDSDARTIDSRDDRVSIAPSLRWNISGRTHLTLLGSYSKERGTPKSWWPSPFIYPQILDLPARLTAGDPSFDRFNRDTRALGYEFEHETDGGWKLSQKLRYATIDIDYRHVYGMDVLRDRRTVTRASLAQRTEGKTLAIDNRMEKDLRWGELRHKLAVGLDYLSYKERGGLGFGWDVPNLDMYAPLYRQPIAYPELEESNVDLKQTGIYTLNQLKWDRWVANLSLRRDKVRTTQTSTTQPRTDDEATTGSAGLLYLFDSGWAPYLSYATSFDPVTGRQFDGSAFKPRRGKQYEVGVKYQPAGSSTLVTASVFDLTQTNVATPDPDHPRFNIQTGEVRSTGFEMEGRFALTPELSTLASYTYLDPRTTRSTRPAEIGRQTFQTSRHMASVWLDYRPRSLPGLMVAAGVRYKDKSPYNLSSSGLVNYNSATTLADLAVAYETPKYRIALNINNVFNKKYFSGYFRGADREATLSFKYYW